MFIIWKTRKVKFVLFNWFLLADIFFANRNDLTLNLPKFARPVFFFFSSRFLALLLIFLGKNSQYFLHFSFNISNAKCNRSRSENLDRRHYRFQPIKFVHSVVPSPCETRPYSKIGYFFILSSRKQAKIQFLARPRRAKW